MIKQSTFLQLNHKFKLEDKMLKVIKAFVLFLCISSFLYINFLNTPIFAQGISWPPYTHKLDKEADKIYGADELNYLLEAKEPIEFKGLGVVNEFGNFIPNNEYKIPRAFLVSTVGAVSRKGQFGNKDFIYTDSSKKKIVDWGVVLKSGELIVEADALFGETTYEKTINGEKVGGFVENYFEVENLGDDYFIVKINPIKLVQSGDLGVALTVGHEGTRIQYKNNIVMRKHDGWYIGKDKLINKRIKVYPSYAGRIEQIYVQKGDKVVVGKTKLFYVEGRRMELEIQMAQAEIEREKAYINVLTKSLSKIENQLAEERHKLLAMSEDDEIRYQNKKIRNLESDYKLEEDKLSKRKQTLLIAQAKYDSLPRPEIVYSPVNGRVRRIFREEYESINRQEAVIEITRE